MKKPNTMRRARRAKILATLGPASSDLATIRALFDAGADVFRLNFSHGTHDDHLMRATHIRAIAAETHRPIGIVADLQGPKLRIGAIKDGQAHLEPGATFVFDQDNTPGNAQRVYFPHAEIYPVLQRGTDILLDDGKLALRVEDCAATQITLRVIVGGTLLDRKGVNIPGAILPLSPLTAKDKKDLAFALDLGVDWVALSFVQRPEDIDEARALIQERAGLITKFEKPQAIAHMDVLVARSDAVMIARGDLGVEIPAEDVPAVQKQLIRCCVRAGKPVIVATQMLESMIHAPTPTRAEASDVATAVYDGADTVMLSAESAQGAYPVAAVTMMDRIIRRVEQDPYYRSKLEHDRCSSMTSTANAITAAARLIAHDLSAPVIATLTTSGFTTLSAARERPNAAILGITPHAAVAQRLALVWGVHPICHDVPNRDDMATICATLAQTHGFAGLGDTIVVTAGVPFQTPGTTNMLRVLKVGEGV